MSNKTTTIGLYLLMRLKELGVDHLFGVPGDFVLGFFNQVLESQVKYIGTCNELNAAYAADAYARVKGLGAFSTTYAVGELSAINGVAGAFSEHIPVVVITGAPATVNFNKSTLLHHTLGDYNIPMKIYEHVTVASALIDNPEIATQEIDRVLSAALFYQRPVYLALSSDIIQKPCALPGLFPYRKASKSSPDSLKEAVSEAVSLFESSSKPIVIADVELIRFKLQDTFKQFLEKTKYPYATMMLAKAIIDEDHPQFIGLYQGDRSREYVQKRVESADAILLLGGLMTDFNTGGFSAFLDPSKTVRANINSIAIKNHYYNNIDLKDFMVELSKKLTKRDLTSLDIKQALHGCSHRRTQEFKSEKNKKITFQRFFDRISGFIQDNSIVIAETGASLFSAVETLMPKGTTFIGQTFYGSIGYTVGATLGAAIADKKRRVVLFVGDGSFQVTAQDLSTMIRYETNPIIFLINNEGYTIERVIVDHSYNDIQNWKYHELPAVFGGKKGWDVHTEDELEEALKYALQNKELCFIEIHTGKMDCSEALRKAGETMAKVNQLK